MKSKLLLVALALCLPLPLAAGDRPSITVLGVAEERVPPDQLQLSCTIRNTGKLNLYDTLWFELAKFPEVSIDSAGFALENRSQVRVIARQKALRAARQKAGEMAAALDARIGTPLAVVENPQQMGLNFSNIASNSLSTTPSGGSERGPLEPGLVSVTERVEVTFELVK